MFVDFLPGALKKVSFGWADRKKKKGLFQVEIFLVAEHCRKAPVTASGYFSCFSYKLFYFLELTSVALLFSWKFKSTADMLPSIICSNKIFLFYVYTNNKSIYVIARKALLFIFPLLRQMQRESFQTLWSTPKTQKLIW